jgi:hypothetical protein
MRVLELSSTLLVGLITVEDLDACLQGEAQVGTG